MRSKKLKSLKKKKKGLQWDFKPQLLYFRAQVTPVPISLLPSELTFASDGKKKKKNNMQYMSYDHLTDLFTAKLPAQYSHIRSSDF